MPRIQSTPPTLPVLSTTTQNLQKQASSQVAIKDSLHSSSTKSRLTILKEKIIAFFRLVIQWVCCIKEKKTGKIPAVINRTLKTQENSKVKDSNIEISKGSKEKVVSVNTHATEKAAAPVKIKQPQARQPIQLKPAILNANALSTKSTSASVKIPDLSKQGAISKQQPPEVDTATNMQAISTPIIHKLNSAATISAAGNKTHFAKRHDHSKSLPAALSTFTPTKPTVTIKPVLSEDESQNRPTTAGLKSPKFATGEDSVKILSGLDLEIDLHGKLLKAFPHSVGEVVDQTAVKPASAAIFKFLYALELGKPEGTKFEAEQQGHLQETEHVLHEHMHGTRSTLTFLSDLRKFLTIILDGRRQGMEAVDFLVKTASLKTEDEESPVLIEENESHFLDELGELIQAVADKVSQEDRKQFLKRLRENIDSLESNEKAPKESRQKFLEGLAFNLKNTFAIEVFINWQKNGVPLLRRN